MAKSTISSMFGTSPIRPLQTHMQSVQVCVKQLIPFFKAVLAGDWETVGKERNEIARLEREADDLKRDLRLQLPKGLFMPVSRRDLLEVLTMQDKIANKAKDIAGIITGRKMVFPEGLETIILEYVQRSIDASAQAQKAINELDELVATGFRGNELSVVEAMIRDLDNIESDTDRIQIDLRSEIYKLEADLPPVNVMFMYTVIDGIGELADRAQRVGSRLQLMLAR
ncbi:MAG: TIGR00153 family protein [Gammaproteobacteria bacterium]